MKKFLSILLCAVIVLGAFSGCGSQGDSNVSSKDESTVTESEGVATATAQGYGGEVSVTVSVKDGQITEVTAEGKDETQGIGSSAIEQLPSKFVEANSFDVDTISGATTTSNAVISAGKKAFAQATGQSTEIADVSMGAGSYTGQGTGYYKPEPVEATVTVDESQIVSIEVSTDNGETKPILQSVIDKMIPRIIEHQSVSVDAIVGATSSSNAVKQAVTDALEQALEEGGSDATAIEAFKIIPEIKPQEHQTIETDVLVVGMGGAGTTAAIRAAQVMHEKSPEDVNVLAIDKAGKYGGTSANTTGMMAINPSKYKEEHNNGEDFMDKAAIREAWLEYTEGDAKTEIVDLMLDNSGDALDWLVYDLGFEFQKTPSRGFTPTDVYDCWFAYEPYNGHNFVEIGSYYDSAYDKYEDWGGEYMLETEAYELIYNSETDTVEGIKARNVVDKTEYTIYADSIILATGGYAGSAEMEEKYLTNDYYPLKGDWKQLGMLQNDGKMIQSAIDNGAGIYNISIPPMVHLAGTPTLTGFDVNFVEGETSRISGRTTAWSVGDLPMHLAISPDSLAVDTNGNRFASEQGVAMLDPWIAGPHYFSIWSQDRIEDIKENGLEYDLTGASTGFLGHNSAIPTGVPLPETEEVLKAGMEAGFIQKADTIEELAELIDIEADSLKATIDSYNSFCESGVDSEFNKEAALLKSVGEGPYYAITCYPYCYSTTGALDIDENMNVLNTEGMPINNLYAVGTDSMGVLFTEKKAYVTYGAAAQGWVYTSGYLCGEIVADKIA